MQKSSIQDNDTTIVHKHKNVEKVSSVHRSNVLEFRQLSRKHCTFKNCTLTGFNVLCLQFLHLTESFFIIISFTLTFMCTNIVLCLP